MTAYLIVRAEVPEADRDAFDRWYETEHLPDAKAVFDADMAERGWSDVTPGVHIAFYAFPDLAKARAILESDEIKTLIAEFDRHWQGRVARTRDIVEIVQTIQPRL
ncbi:MAG: hypothetical protein R3F54_20755 [Alphaproteobacteria bacterium]